MPEIDDQTFKRWMASPYFKVLGKIGIMLCMTLVLAKAVTSLALVALSDYALPPRQVIKAGDVFAAAERFNYRNLRKAILDRNLFNSTGEVPEESDGRAQAGAAPAETFNINAPCRDTTLNVTLVGTIYTNHEATTIATIQEKGIESPDIYRAGDVIIGSNNATVARIERKKIIINNGGVKECIELADPKLANMMVSADQLPNLSDIPAPAGAGAPETAPKPLESAGGAVSVNCDFVEAELGADFGKILSTVRMVPNPTPSGGINGFKVFAIQSGSLLDKVGLKNGDVVQQVNDTNLSQPDQGFALFQSLQDEESIRINVLRQGDNPITLNVSVNCK